MKKVIAFLAVVISFSLTACGDDIPSESQGKKVLVDNYEKSECLTLVGFKKTNGRKFAFDGASEYTMEYTAEMELKSACYGYFSDANKKFFSSPNKKYSEQGDKNMNTLGYRRIKEGEKVSINGKINFVKKENGWEGQEFVF